MGLFALLGAYAAAVLLVGLLYVALGPEGFAAKMEPLSPHTCLFVLLGGAALGGAYWLHRQGEEATARAVLPIAAMTVFGPVIFYLHWPYLWHHPVDRTAWYLAFHAQHNQA